MIHNVLPFPRCRDRRFVRRHARRMSEINRAAAERYLECQLDIQCAVWRGRGINPGRIAVERKALETAIRSEVWRLVLLGHDGAA
ncbi:hypothetical protein LMIY3S_01806 [Labrys miyagiensis]